MGTAVLLKYEERPTQTPSLSNYKGEFNFQVTKKCFGFQALAAVLLNSYI
jgi:hypothetical protein